MNAQARGDNTVEEKMETDWTSEWTPPARDRPELDAKTLAAVRALQAGEIEASVGHLFEIFGPELSAYFRRNSCQDDEADDLTQNVFIRMLEQIGTLKEAASFHFWLFRIAGNYLRNYARDRARSREGLEDFTDEARRESESGALWARGSFEPNPETQLAVSETVDRRRLILRKLFKATKLAPRTRQALLLRLQGASDEEIGRALEMPVNNVRRYVSRARDALLRNVDKIDGVVLDTLEDRDDDLVADLAPEILTFKREALEADPAYFRAAALEAASAGYEEDEESDEEALDLLAEEVREDEIEVQRVADSPAAIAAVVRQDQKRGRPRRRATRTIPPAGRRAEELELGRLAKDDLGYPAILLEEAAALLNGSSPSLALKAKLTCAGALLGRGRRFAAARRVAEMVRQAIVLIGDGPSDGNGSSDGDGRRDEIRHKVMAGRGLLRSYVAQHQL